MITGNKVRLREKKLSDARNDYAWKTDPDLVRYDAAEVITIPFSHYLIEHSSELRYSLANSQRFGVETLDGTHIGNCSYYNVDEAQGETEIGITIGDRNYWNKGYGADAVTTLVNHIFHTSKINRVYLKTLDWNRRAQQCYLKCGFTPCGNLYRDGYSFVMMEISRKNWQQQKKENNRKDGEGK